MKLHVDDGARKEMEDAIEYSNHHFGVGVKLAQAIIREADHISTDPFRFRELAGGLRIHHLPHFPFYFIFGASTSSEIVSIYVFGHTSRRPNYWKSRIPKP